MRKWLIFLIFLTLTGCSKSSEENLNIQTDEESVLSSFVSENVITYDGILDYTHIITPSISDNKLITSFEGELKDLVGESIFFKLSYQIDGPILKELYYSDNPGNLYFTSIIPEKVLLKAPLEVGNSWDQEFTNNSISHKAKTTLVKIELSDSGKRLYTTETVVFGIKGYKDDRYYEKTIFEENYGIIYFEKSLELVKNEAGEYEEIGFNFSYWARGKQIN